MESITAREGKLKWKEKRFSRYSTNSSASLTIKLFRFKIRARKTKMCLTPISH
jgi:hypothetical protein